jgi:uncharacterized protein (DUF1697 family)
VAIYIALLRGINVSGKKIIKMDRLKSMFEALGFQNVIPYIQSGNVVFETAKTETGILSETIANKINHEFGFEVTVIVRTLEELKEAIRQNPFGTDAIAEDEKLYITFLSKEPTAEAIAIFESFENNIDKFRILNREVYVLCGKNGYGKSLFSNTFVEKKLKVSATTRNLETTNKLVAIAESL